MPAEQRWALWSIQQHSGTVTALNALIYSVDAERQAGCGWIPPLALPSRTRLLDVVIEVLPYPALPGRAVGGRLHRRDAESKRSRALPHHPGEFGRESRVG